jgi:hypothetical protein
LSADGTTTAAIETAVVAPTSIEGLAPAYSNGPSTYPGRLVFAMPDVPAGAGSFDLLNPEALVKSDCPFGQGCVFLIQGPIVPISMQVSVNVAAANP